MAKSTGLASMAPEEQADPVDTAIPSRSREINRLSALILLTAEVESMWHTILLNQYLGNMPFVLFDFVQN